LATVRISDIGGFAALRILGVELHRGQEVAITPLAALLRYSDKNLTFTFEESDRKELMQIDPELFDTISEELKKAITTHNDLVGLLLPKKASAPKKKVAPKSKKSSLTEE
tara:strand:+ start:467 stop:796 length:330 start_codon:yes stop_codon:yes gene_type:complete